ncbi:hypothetical protein Hanom_Chr10g00875441 [Helianthus anomalus]
MSWVKYNMFLYLLLCTFSVGLSFDVLEFFLFLTFIIFIFFFYFSLCLMF